MRLLVVSAVATVLGACGRLGFDEISPGDPSARLAAIELWVSPDERLDVPMFPAFQPQVGSYAVEVGLVLQRVQVSARPVEPTTTITIEGVPTESGVLSAPIALGVGTNVISVTGTSPLGAQMTYSVDVARAAELAQDAYAKASNTGATDYFGQVLAISGDTLAVAASLEDSSATGIDGDQGNNSALDTGAVYVFVRADGGWSQQAYIKASNPDNSDTFGISVALAGDTLVVGAREDSSAAGVDGDQADNGAVDSGAVYVFTRTAGAWSQQAYLKASNTETNDRFGASVAVAGDTIAVGAAGEDSNAFGIDGNQADNSAPESGAVYVFTRTDGLWSQQAYLKASNTGANDSFGDTVALSGDTLAVGAFGEDSGVIGNQTDNSAPGSGAVYMFARTGTAWSQQAYLKASNVEASDLFGDAIAVAGDTLVVSAGGEDSSATGVDGDQADNTAISSGAVYVFTRMGSVWSQQAYLKASNTQANDGFGSAVTVSGATIAVGAPGEDSSAVGVAGDQADNGTAESGAAYLFGREGSTWSQLAYVKASNTGGSDRFGISVAVSGETLAIGAPGESSIATGVGGDQSNNSVSGSGAVYVFR